jgi:multiple sugar transport system permease protein
MLSISLQTDAEIYSPNFTLLPASPQFRNYIDVLNAGNWGRYFFNSALVTIIVVVFSLIINSMAGFVFARIPFKYSGFLFLLVLSGMMIPIQVTMIPVFTMLRQVPLVGGNDIFGQGGSGLYDTLSGLMLPFIAGSFGVFLCRQYYTTFPPELDDAAKIDGCGRFAAYRLIYVPISGPLFASLGVLKFAGTWNEYTWPLIMTRSNNTRTVQLALSLFRNELGTDWRLLMGAAVLVGLPICLVFFFAQKQFIAGITAGAVKG